MSTDPRRAEAEASLATDPEPPDAPDAPDAPDGDAIRHEIERTREDLGETVNALSKKTDVKARAPAKAVPVIAGAIALVVVAWMVRRRRRNS
jgi:Protein of unknown function (DUF3618)